MVPILCSAAAGLAGGAAGDGGAAAGRPPLWMFLRQASAAGAPTTGTIFTSEGGASWTSVTPAGSDVSWPSWSPDGTTIAYIVMRNTGSSDETDDVVVANWDGSEPRQLTDRASAKLLRWSPD